jgi:predicted enzyme related to lactoylglutathione lyase
MANEVGWFEIHGKDGAKIQKFYADLFGWKVDANNPMNYGMVEGKDGGIGGGLTGSEQAPMVTVYVNVDDLDATLKKAEGLGGKTVMPPMDVPGGPKIAMFADPDGNVIGVMKPPAM